MFFFRFKKGAPFYFFILIGSVLSILLRTRITVMVNYISSSVPEYDWNIFEKSVK